MLPGELPLLKSHGLAGLPEVVGTITPLPDNVPVTAEPKSLARVMGGCSNSAS